MARFLTCVIVASVWLCAIAFSSESQPSHEGCSDPAKTFSIDAPSPWVRHPEIEQAKPIVVLALTQGAAKEGHGVPVISIMEIPEQAGNPSNLDATAASLVKKAKANHSDQGGYGKIDVVKLDGVDARSVEYILEQGGNVMHFKTTLASRRGKMYLIQFICSEAEYKDKAEDGEKVLRSFHWT